MDKGDLLLGNARLPQALVHKGRFLPGADDAHIGRLAPQHLHLRLKVVLMAVGHDDHIVLRRQRQVVADAVKVAADGPVRLGKMLRRGKARPIIHHHGTEANRPQQRRQRTSDMSRAEDDRALPHRQRQGEHALARLRRLGDMGRGAVQRQHQPDGHTVTHAAQHLRRQRVPDAIRQPGGSEQHRHIAAAGHAQLTVTGELEVIQGVHVLTGQQRPGQLNGPQLHRAAADGAGEQTLRPHQHLAARAAGGRAVIPHDGGQHGVLLLFPLVEQGLEDVVHMCLLSRAIGSGGAAPCSFIQPAASTAGREFATSALYWSMVRSQW